MIREYCMNDIPFIYKGLKSYKSAITSEYLDKNLKAKISNYILYPECKIYVYEQEDKIKGFIFANFNWIDWETGFSYILIEEFYSESQIGAYRLIKYIEQLAKKQKKNLIGLTKNENLIKDAHKEGWEIDTIQYVKKWEDIYED